MSNINDIIKKMPFTIHTSSGDTLTLNKKKKGWYCSNKKYMSGQGYYLFPQCNGCQHEVSDLFHGTDGREVWLWFCRFVPVDG